MICNMHKKAIDLVWSNLSHRIMYNHAGSHEVTRESVKVVKFEVINQFWIVRFHCYSHSELS